MHVTNNYDQESWKVHTFPPQTGRYVRVYCIQRTTEWGYSIFELEVYQDCEGADIDRTQIVDIGDLSILSLYWLESDCDLYDDCEGADLFDDNTIDFLDFLQLADHWSCNSCSIP